MMLRIKDDEYRMCRNIIFSEPPVDMVYDEDFILKDNETAFAVEYLPGQYDQRADSAAQCIQLLTRGERPLCRTATLLSWAVIFLKKRFRELKITV